MSELFKPKEVSRIGQENASLPLHNPIVSPEQNKLFVVTRESNRNNIPSGFPQYKAVEPLSSVKKDVSPLGKATTEAKGSIDIKEKKEVKEPGRHEKEPEREERETKRKRERKSIKEVARSLLNRIVALRHLKRSRKLKTVETIRRIGKKNSSTRRMTRILLLAVQPVERVHLSWFRAYLVSLRQQSGTFTLKRNVEPTVSQ